MSNHSRLLWSHGCTAELEKDVGAVCDRGFGISAKRPGPLHLHAVPRFKAARHSGNRGG